MTTLMDATGGALWPWVQMPPPSAFFHCKVGLFPLGAMPGLYGAMTLTERQVSQLISKPTTTDFLNLSIFRLKALGYLERGASGTIKWTSQHHGEQGSIGLRFDGSAFHLSYTTRSGEYGARQSIDDRIAVTHTYPHLGGSRTWFVCPGCNTRRGVLLGGTYFRCRQCYCACYDTQKEDWASRQFTRMYKRRRKYGCYHGIDFPFPSKPKWMRWATYHRLVGQDLRDSDIALGAMDQKIEMFRRRLGGDTF